MDTPLNIVVVEDHDALREVTIEALRMAGHHVIGLNCAEDLTEQMDALLIDLMVIDLNLPGEDGISLTRRIRHSQPNIGIIIVTARSLISEKKAGYESGADIYLTKPTSVDELSAAINALTRRIKPVSRVVHILKLNLHNHILLGHQCEIGLSMQESTLLAAFIRAPQFKLESCHLIEFLGKNGAEYSKASLEVLIARLRKKLVQVGECGQPIKSIRQFGYKLCVQVEIL